MGQESKGKSESIFDSFAKLKRLKSSVEEQNKKGGDATTAVQGFAAKEATRKKKEADEAAKKKATPVTTAPSEDGFLTRMYKKYVSGGDKK